MNSRKYNIIVTSDELWSDMMHTQLHYALELSKEHTVYYINPPKKWKIRNLFIWKNTGLIRINENLKIINYHNYFPIVLFTPLFTYINDFFNTMRIIKLIEAKERKLLLWRFDHMRLVNTFGLSPEYRIYHIVDNYFGKKYDKTIAKTSDLIITTSPRLVKPYSGVNANTINIPQGVSFDEFKIDENEIRILKNKYGSFIVYVGSLSSSIDFDLIKLTAQKFQDTNILIIGPVTTFKDDDKLSLEEMKSIKNILFLGLIHGAKLKCYIAASIAGIIPYKFNQTLSNVIRSPLKAINYLAQFKPVITTFDCEIPNLNGKAIFLADTTGEFLNLISEVISGRLFFDKIEVEKYLRTNSYQKLLRKIFKIVEESV